LIRKQKELAAKEKQLDELKEQYLFGTASRGRDGVTDVGQKAKQGGNGPLWPEKEPAQDEESKVAITRPIFDRIAECFN
jgi:hypothetical protein